MELEIGNTYNVKVSKIIKSGIIVEMPDESTEFIHLSNISDQYVNNISDFVSTGYIYTATCINGKSRPFELSLKPLNLKPASLNKPTVKNHKYVNETTVRKNNNAKQPKSLDDMIANMNACYEDKMKAYNKNRYDRRKKNKARRQPD